MWIGRVTTGRHLNAIDLIYAVSQPKSRSSAADTLRRLMRNKLFDESDLTYVVHSQYKKISIVSFAKAIKLLMVLEGKTARVERGKFARVLHLFYAGDAELKAEIDSNANSQEWLNVLAREALSAERVAATDLQLVPAGGTSNAGRQAASTGALPVPSKTPGNTETFNRQNCHRQRGRMQEVTTTPPPVLLV